MSGSKLSLAAFVRAVGHRDSGAIRVIIPRYDPLLIGDPDPAKICNMLSNALLKSRHDGWSVAATTVTRDSQGAYKLPAPGSSDPVPTVLVVFHAPQYAASMPATERRSELLERAKACDAAVRTTYPSAKLVDVFCVRDGYPVVTDSVARLPNAHFTLHATGRAEKASIVPVDREMSLLIEVITESSPARMAVVIDREGDVATTQQHEDLGQMLADAANRTPKKWIVHVVQPPKRSDIVYDIQQERVSVIVAITTAAEQPKQNLAKCVTLINDAELAYPMYTRTHWIVLLEIPRDMLSSSAQTLEGSLQDTLQLWLQQIQKYKVEARVIAIRGHDTNIAAKTAIETYIQKELTDMGL